MTGPRRRFTGRPGPATPCGVGLDAVGDVLLSAAAEGSPQASHAPPDPEPRALRGLYVLVPLGIEPGRRRRAALAVASRLAPSRSPAALFLFEHGRADAHVFGEPACGRLGPQNYLTSADMDRTIGGLVSQCEQIGVVLLDGPGAGFGRLAKRARRAVFVAAPDAESAVETYRSVKMCRAAGLDTDPAVFVLGSEERAEVGRFHRRLRRTARLFLGCDVSLEGFMGSESGPAPGGRTGPLRIFAQAPAAEVWQRLLAQGEDGDAAPCGNGARAAPQAPACPAIAFWESADPEALLAAIEAQVPVLLGNRFRLAFRVDVAEPDAPPLVAVRDDGALVAVLVRNGGAVADTLAATRWLAVHRTLLGRAYPSAGISNEAEPCAMVLAPLRLPTSQEGTRRFLPVRVNGRAGVVLLP